MAVDLGEEAYCVGRTWWTTTPDTATPEELVCLTTEMDTAVLVSTPWEEGGEVRLRVVDLADGTEVWLARRVADEWAGVVAVEGNLLLLSEHDVRRIG